MRKVGEKSFPIYSTSSIVVTKHEMRRPLQLIVRGTYGRIHEIKENEVLCTRQELTTEPVHEEESSLGS